MREVRGLSTQQLEQFIHDLRTRATKDPQEIILGKLAEQRLASAQVSLADGAPNSAIGHILGAFDQALYLGIIEGRLDPEKTLLAMSDLLKPEVSIWTRAWRWCTEYLNWFRAAATE